MKLKVHVYGLSAKGENEKLGEIYLENGRLSASEDSVVLQNIMRDSIRLPNRTEVFPAEKPELFIRSLCYHYKSAYLYVSKPHALEPGRRFAGPATLC
jgi:hypothetical protein